MGNDFGEEGNCRSFHFEGFCGLGNNCGQVHGVESYQIKLEKKVNNLVLEIKRNGFMKGCVAINQERRLSIFKRVVVDNSNLKF